MGKIMDRDPTGRTVLITGGRLSFGETLKEKGLPKKADPEAVPSHGCNIIIERSHKDFESNVNAVKSALMAAGEEFKKRPNLWEELFEDSPKQLCFRKGERFKNSESGEVYSGYEGNFAIAGKGPRAGQNRPLLKDRYKRDVAHEDIPDVMYNGTYGDFVVSFYGTDKGGTQRITCSIEAIRSYQEGERMGGGGIDVRDDDFDDLPGDDSFGEDSSGGADDLLGGGSKSGGSLDLLG